MQHGVKKHKRRTLQPPIGESIVFSIILVSVVFIAIAPYVCRLLVDYGPLVYLATLSSQSTSNSVQTHPPVFAVKQDATTHHNAQRLYHTKIRECDDGYVVLRQQPDDGEYICYVGPSRFASGYCFYSAMLPAAPFLTYVHHRWKEIYGEAVWIPVWTLRNSVSSWLPWPSSFGVISDDTHCYDTLHSLLYLSAEFSGMAIILACTLASSVYVMLFMGISKFLSKRSKRHSRLSPCKLHYSFENWMRKRFRMYRAIGDAWSKNGRTPMFSISVLCVVFVVVAFHPVIYKTFENVTPSLTSTCFVVLMFIFVDIAFMAPVRMISACLLVLTMLVLQN